MSDLTEEVTDAAAVTDGADVEVSRGPKGPDPAVWGDEETRRQQDIEAGKFTERDLVSEALAAMIAAGEEPIVDLGDGHVVKGPDPAQWSVPSDAPEDDDEL